MMSPASTRTRSPRRSWLAGTTSISPVAATRLAVVSRRVRRRVSACALPRPSAIASAKLAKRTVNQSQTEMAKTNESVATPPAKRPLKKTTVVTTEPTSTTNITGLRACKRGSSLVNEPISAPLMISGVHALVVRTRFISVISSGGACGGASVTAIGVSLPLRTACRRAAAIARQSGRARAPG